MPKIIAYKGFSKNLQCLSFQYEIGKKYKMKGIIKACNLGFHACTMPFSVFNYYSPANNRFALVELSGDIDKESHKIASSKIAIKKELSLFDMVKAQIEWAKSSTGISKHVVKITDCSVTSNTISYSSVNNTGDYSVANNTGQYSSSSNTGYRSASSNTAYRSTATNTGYQSISINAGHFSSATNTGDYSSVNNTGDQSASSNTGYKSEAISMGDRSTATNTGDKSAVNSIGNESVATSTGYKASASTEGKDSIAFASGIYSRAKASAGSWIVIAERNKDGKIIYIKTAKAGIDLDPDIYYELVHGKFIRSENQKAIT